MNPPVWPESVYVFDPARPAEAQRKINEAFVLNGGHDPVWNGQFSKDHFAFLFMMGKHDVEVPVGYYTSVYGMGKSPKDTMIKSVRCENGDFDFTGGALDNFWRSAENFHIVPTDEWNGDVGMLWAVSQAAPLRRVFVEGNLFLSQYNEGCCAGYASGGFLSDSVVTGRVESGTQQQWITRNVNLGKWVGGVWNLVNVGVKGDVDSTYCPADNNGCAISTEESTPVIAEKMYIHFDGSRYFLMVPPVEYDKVGSSEYGVNDLEIDFENVFVANENTTIDFINSKLAQGIHVIFTPGNYNLDQSINIVKSNTYILGLGIPTLISGNGNPCITVADNLNGVRVDGLLLQAGKQHSRTLLQWGTRNSMGNNDPKNPSFIHDIFIRVGGTNDPREYQVSTRTMVEIYSSFVVLDNTWFWRADHDITGIVKNGDNPVDNGFVVGAKARNVTVYGLAVEHTLQDLTVWDGENGRTYFYQSEFPYDVKPDFGIKGFTSYKVNDNVQTHTAYGLGVYSFFRDYTVNVHNGIETGTSKDISITNPFSIFLNGQGSIQKVINGKGTTVDDSNHKSFACRT